MMLVYIWLLTWARQAYYSECPWIAPVIVLLSCCGFMWCNELILPTVSCEQRASYIDDKRVQQTQQSKYRISIWKVYYKDQIEMMKYLCKTTTQSTKHVSNFLKQHDEVLQWCSTILLQPAKTSEWNLQVKMQEDYKYVFVQTLPNDLIWSSWPQPHMIGK